MILCSCFDPERFRRSSTLQRTNTTPVQRQLLGNLNQVQREYKESDAEEEVDEMGDDKEDDVTFFSSQQSSASKYQDFASLARDPNQSSVYERDDINGRNRTFGSARVSFHSHYMKSLSKWIKWSLVLYMSLINVHSAESLPFIIECRCTSHTCSIECDMAVPTFDLLCDCDICTHVPYHGYSICVADTVPGPNYQRDELARTWSYAKYHGRSP